MEKICGFVVVRKPKYATNAALKHNMSIGQFCYHGIERLRWEDFNLAYYSGHLPLSLMPIWQERKQDNADFSGLDLLKSYEHARDVLRFSGEKSEIIAVWSPELAEIKETVNCELELEYLGLDCVGLGEWSVLLLGAYAEPDYFARTVDRLNDHGLLTSNDDCDALFDQYVEASSKDIVEPLANDVKATHVKVFRVIS